MGRKFLIAASLLYFLSISINSFANTISWHLDSDTARLTFSSVKNSSIKETHKFLQLTGNIRFNNQLNQGVIKLLIDTNKFDTGIAIREQRMRKYLLQSSVYPYAEYTAELSKEQIKILQSLVIGGVDTKAINNFALTLNGVLKFMNLKLPIVINMAISIERFSNKIKVRNTTPIIIDLNKLHLLQGLEKLRQLAGLASIKPETEVNFSLEFVPDEITR